eukprot:RCo043788
MPAKQHPNGKPKKSARKKRRASRVGSSSSASTAASPTLEVEVSHAALVGEESPAEDAVVVLAVGKTRFELPLRDLCGVASDPSAASPARPPALTFPVANPASERLQVTLRARATDDLSEDEDAASTATPPLPEA